MDRALNPFSPGAGTQPPELTGRDEVLEATDVTLRRILLNRPSRSTLLIGLRGVGKTVLLNRIKNQAESHGYETVLIESPEGKNLAELLVTPLRKIILGLNRKANVRAKISDAMGALRSFASVFKIKMGDVSIEVNEAEGVADSGVLEEDLADLLTLVGEAAREANTGVAVFIDELQYVPESDLSALLAAIHRVGQMNLPFVVFGAGLPQLAGLTGEAKSYAERLFYFQSIGQLSEVDAKLAISEPIREEGEEIEQDALEKIFLETEGYPYFLQEWGQHSWNLAKESPISAEVIESATELAIKVLDDGFFKVRFDRLTPLEKEYLRAMAELGPGPHRSGDIASLLKRPVEQIAPTRSNIITKGMIFAPNHGDTAFTVPKFNEYMIRMMPIFSPTPVKKRISK